MAKDVLVYDIETKETFQDTGGRDPQKLHISVIGAYSYLEKRLIGFTESNLPEFWRRLEQCELLIGFNNHGFDDLVCAVYFPEIDKVPSLDLMSNVAAQLGFRIKLDNLAQATLGTAKSGDGLKAIKLYQEGKIDELLSYCLDDVKITKELYEYGKENGKLYYTDLQGKKEVMVDFTQGIKQPKEALNLSLF
jgi:DEAD/DEAH box helicase domain-containing protein